MSRKNKKPLLKKSRRRNSRRGRILQSEQLENRTLLTGIPALSDAGEFNDPTFIDAVFSNEAVLVGEMTAAGSSAMDAIAIDVAIAASVPLGENNIGGNQDQGNNQDQQEGKVEIIITQTLPDSEEPKGEPVPPCDSDLELLEQKARREGEAEYLDSNGWTWLFIFIPNEDEVEDNSGEKNEGDQNPQPEAQDETDQDTSNRSGRANIEAKRANIKAKRANIEAKRTNIEAKRPATEAKRANIEAKRAKQQQAAESRFRHAEKSDSSKTEVNEKRDAEKSEADRKFDAYMRGLGQDPNDPVARAIMKARYLAANGGGATANGFGNWWTWLKSWFGL